MKNGIYRLLYNDDLVGIRFVTEFGVFDTQAGVLSDYLTQKQINDFPRLYVRSEHGRFITEDEYNSSQDYPEVTNGNLILLQILLNLFDLHALPCDIVLGKEQLSNLCRVTDTFMHRFCFRSIKRFLSDSEDRNILSIFGLRRTGKTVLMKQAVSHLLQSGVSSNQIAFITFSSGSHVTTRMMQDISTCLFKRLGIKYLFIDEFTCLYGDLSFATMYSDVYFDRKVIISGTNSVSFLPLFSDILFDRTVTLSTTYISYKEFAHVTGKSLIDYISQGGIFQRGDIYTSEHGDLDAYISSSNKYFQTAVVGNLCGSFKRFEAVNDNYVNLAKLYYDNSSNFSNILFKWFQRYGQELTITLLHKVTTEFAEFSATISNVSKQHEASWSGFEESFNALYREALAITLSSCDSETLEEFKEFLYFINCLVDGRVTLITEGRKREERKEFLVPLQLKWGLFKTLVSVLDSHYYEVASANGVSLDLSKFRDRLLSTAMGFLVEDIVYMELITQKVPCKKYRVHGREVDLILNDTDLFEIKLTDEVHISDLRWLFHPEVQRDLSPTSLNVLCNIPEDKDLECSAKEVYEECYRIAQQRGHVPAWLRETLSAVDDKRVTVHYRNISKWLREFKV